MSQPVQVVFCTDGVYPQLVGGIQKHTRLLVEELARTKKLKLQLFISIMNRMSLMHH